MCQGKALDLTEEGGYFSLPAILAGARAEERTR
jgi:hypothetical protein